MPSCGEVESIFTLDHVGVLVRRLEKVIRSSTKGRSFDSVCRNCTPLVPAYNFQKQISIDFG